LHQQLKDTDAQLKSKEVFGEALSASLERLNRTAMAHEATNTTMRNELAHEKQKRQSEQDMSRCLSRSLHKKQEEVKTKEHEILSLKSEIEEHKKQVRSIGLLHQQLRSNITDAFNEIQTSRTHKTHEATRHYR